MGGWGDPDQCLRGGVGKGYLQSSREVEWKPTRASAAHTHKV